jgi:hypothetical protein
MLTRTPCCRADLLYPTDTPLPTNQLELPLPTLQLQAHNLWCDFTVPATGKLSDPLTLQLALYNSGPFIEEVQLVLAPSPDFVFSGDQDSSVRIMPAEVDVQVQTLQRQFQLFGLRVGAAKLPSILAVSARGGVSTASLLDYFTAHTLLDYFTAHTLPSSAHMRFSGLLGGRASVWPKKRVCATIVAQFTFESPALNTPRACGHASVTASRAGATASGTG